MLLFVVLVLLFSYFVVGNNIDYQIHSHNDLREWNQLLIKGARRFKVDPHYMYPEDCEKASIDGDKGCFVLNHDKPLPKLNTYNTSDDLLNYLQSDEFVKITSNQYTTIALCFKSAPDKCQEDSINFKNWLDLVDNFYNGVITSGISVNVEFILDGDAKPKDCLKEKWETWNSVWINSDSPDEAFYNNDVENGNYRFQVINDPESITNWTWMAEQNYGKFGDKSSKYPYQLWEPDRQEDFLAYIDIYKNTVVTETGEVAPPHPAGFHFAINIDIAMFDVYTSGASGRSINAPLFRNATYPVIVCVPSKKSVLQDEESAATFLTVFSMPAVDGAMALYMNMIEYVNATFAHLKHSNAMLPRSDWLLDSQARTASVHYIGGDDDIPSTQVAILLMDNGRLMVLMNAARMSQIDITSTWNTTVLHERYVYDMTEILFNSDSESNLYVILSKDKSNVLLLNYIEIDIKTENKSGLSVDVEMLHEAHIELILSNNSNSTYDEKEISSCSLKFLNSTVLGVVCAIDGIVWSSVTAFDIQKIFYQDAMPLQFVPLSVGKTVDLNALGGTGDNDGVVMLIVGDGYCFNAHHKNTRAFPSVCAASGKHLHSTPKVLDYSIGLFDDWVDVHTDYAASGGLGSKWEYAVTSCHPRIMHGSYDQGGYPVAALGRLNNETIFIELHEGLIPSEEVVAKESDVSDVHGYSIRSADIAIDNGCGIPMAYEGVIADSFYVESWIQSLRTHT